MPNGAKALKATIHASNLMDSASGEREGSDMADIICAILISLTLIIIIMWLRSIEREQSRIDAEFEELRAQYDLMRRELADYLEDMLQERQ